MKLTTIVLVIGVTVFLAIMAQMAVGNLSDFADQLSSAQKALLDANI